MAARTKASHAPPTKPARRKLPGKDMTSKKGQGKGKGKEDAAHPSTEHTPLQGTQTTGWDGKEFPWEWTSITSPAASKVPPIFTKDGSYFFSLVGSSVQIHSTATGRVVSTLTALSNSTASGNHFNSFSCAVINPCNPFQLITGSLDGRLMIWDFLDGTLLRTVDIAQPIHLICAHEQFKDYVFVAASRPSSKSIKHDNNAVVLRVSLQNVDPSTNMTSLRSADVLPVGKTRFPTGLAISPNGAWLVATAGNKVYVAKPSALTAGFTKYVSPERLTCLAFHPSEEYFATGDDKGVVRLWYCLNDDLAVNVRGLEKKAQVSSMHWHAHAISALAFTSNGAYLLSGGEEAVLVIWQLHTGRKEFVPRVGSAINTISLSRSKTGEEEYLLGLSDATYVFVNAGTLKVSRSYSRVKIDPGTHVNDPSPSKATITPLVVHAPSSTILLPSSHPSSLQIYSPSTSTLISELEVSPSNRVSRRDDKPIEHSRVEHCVVSLSGLWMATVDVREGDDDFRMEIYLKFWSWDEKNSLWILNTRIDKPHASKRISSLIFSYDRDEDMSLQLVTVGEDGIVKVWRLRGRKLGDGKQEEFWVARATLNYHSEVPRFADWSKDASLLAVSYESCVIIYETSTYAVLCTLTSSECTNPRSVHFIGRRNLLVGGSTRLILWDIITHTVSWHRSTKNKIQSIVPHPSGSSFGVFEDTTSNDSSKITRISIFSLQSPNLLRMHILPFALRTKVWYLNAAQPSQFSFLGINEKWSLVAFGDSINLSQEDTSTRELTTDTAVRKPTLLQDIFGVSTFIEPTKTPFSGSVQHELPSVSKSAEEIFETPAHLTPALNTFFDTLVHTFLKKRAAEEEVVPSPDIPEMDVDEDDDDGEAELHGVAIAPTRTVTSSEMNDLVGLFRAHAVRDQPSSHSVKVNGKPVNGVREAAAPSRRPPPKIVPNGVSHKPKMPTIAPSDVSSDSSATSPPLVNGRKRKKP